MKKSFVLLGFLCLSVLGFSQAPDTIKINYLNRIPFSFTEGGTSKGIEIEILTEYVNWLKAKKNSNIVVRYTDYNDYDTFLAETKQAGKKCIGLGSITITQDMLKEIDFSTGYLKDVSFCITNGNAPDVKTKTKDEMLRTFGSMTALTIENTSYQKFVAEMKKQFVPDLKVSLYTNEKKILDDISKNVLYFGYVDAIGFWYYLKTNPGKFLKMQKTLNQSKEELGFLMPKGSPHKALFNEFFSGPGGFKTTPAYRAILEKNLGSYMAQNVAIN